MACNTADYDADVDIRPGAASESRAALESELDWLDAKLSDSRFYLAGEYFSRADLTVASLLAGFASPKENVGLSRNDAPRRSRC